MTRRDYIKLSAAMKESKPSEPKGAAYHQWVHSITKLADALHYDNPRFDYARFIGACGGKTDE